MNLKYVYQLREPIQALMREASRINSYKPQKYWYPLSIATYDYEEILAAVVPFVGNNQNHANSDNGCMSNFHFYLNLFPAF